MSTGRPQRPRISEVDIGPCGAVAFDQDGEQWVVLLPGAGYPTTAPLFWFAREAALAGGRNVLAVVDRYDGDTDPLRWAEERAEASLRHIGAGPHTVLVGKSITSLAAPVAARRALHAVWLTPLLGGRILDGGVIIGVLED